MDRFELTFIRHGQSVWNEENRFTGWTDVALSNLVLKNRTEQQGYFGTMSYRQTWLLPWFYGEQSIRLPSFSIAFI